MLWSLMNKSGLFTLIPSLSSAEQNKYQHYRDAQLIKCVLYKPEDPGIQIKPGDGRASPYYPGMAVQIDQPPGFP